MMDRHPLETELALYAGGDLSGWRRMRTALHVRRCADCLVAVDAYRVDQQELIDTGDELPAGLKWDRLAAEMSANIHLGLSAGECVAPAAPLEPQTLTLGWTWRAAAAMVVLTLVFGAAWWLNPVRPQPMAETGLQVSADGVKLSENGGVLELGAGDAEPALSTVSLDGSGSLRSVDPHTFQVTITAVTWEQ